MNRDTPAAGKWDPATTLARYDATAIRAAHQVISSYSTSFSLSTRLLRGQVREDIRNLYAMVRIADEIVDGACQADAAATLAAYERQVRASASVRFHTDPVVHAFALTARRCALKDTHLAAFFASMRADLAPAAHDAASLGQYVFGSAEVIGLMCLDIFLTEYPREVPRAQLEEGARALGSAFQKINFLRDLHTDTVDLGRDYFPALDDSAKAEHLRAIRAELGTAYACIPLLPTDARVGVLAAADLFSELADLLEEASVAEIYRRRIQVPKHKKLRILARAVGKSSRR